MALHALVTGHSRGLGAAIAAELLGRGIRVLGLSRRVDEAAAHRWGDTLQQVPLDLADTAALLAWLAGPTLPGFAAAAHTLLLVDNAGTVQPIGPLQSQPPAEIARAVALNVTAPLLLTQAAVAVRAPGCELRVLQVSSGAARNAYAGWSVYGATKAALDHHARAVVLDATPDLRICSLAPGVIDTDMQGELRAVSLDRFPQRGRFEALKAQGQLSSPADAAARLVDHLLSDRYGDEVAADLRTLGGAGGR